MFTAKLVESFNKHLNTELYSAYLYLSMSSYANSVGFKGVASWFHVQYQEEMVHFMKFYDFINARGENARVGGIAAPPHEFGSLLDMFSQTLKHEQFITSCINDLVDLSLAEKDHASNIFLQWFVTEQIEEEENDRDIIAKLKLIGDNGQGLLLLDNELATRVFTPPPAGQGQ